MERWEQFRSIYVSFFLLILCLTLRLYGDEALSSCIFCTIGRHEKQADIVAKFNHCYVIKDQYPVSKGHILIIPYEHTENWFTASEQVRLEMMEALYKIKAFWMQSIIRMVTT